MSDRYVGQNSIPALLREQSTPSDKNDSVDFRRDMRSILGLDNSAPFPLMSQYHMHRIAQDISNELPSDREVMKYGPYCFPTWTHHADLNLDFLDHTKRFHNHFGGSLSTLTISSRSSWYIWRNDRATRQFRTSLLGPFLLPG